MVVQQALLLMDPLQVLNLCVGVCVGGWSMCGVKISIAQAGVKLTV